MAWAFEVKVNGKWYPNEVRFATEREASQAGYNKFFNWTQCDDYRVVERGEEANYRYDFDTGRSIHIPTEGIN